MAFGDLKGTLTVSAGSITNPFSATGSVSVAVGDLVFCVLGQQTNLTVTAVGDNLGHTYTATNAGTDAGTVTARAFFVRVTTAGTLTSVNATTSASTNDAAFLAAVIEGPFEAVPLDVSAANITTDITSPFTCPTTGTLNQDREVVIGWGAADQSTVWAATSPNLLAGNANNVANIKVAIGYQAVTATTAVLPAFTAAANPTQSVLGTSAFRRTRAFGTQGNLVLSTVAPTVAATANAAISPTAGQLALSTVAPTGAVNMPRQPRAGQLLLNNWIVDESGDPILDENSDPILDAVANAPTSIATAFTSRTPAAGDLVLSGTAPTVALSVNLSITPPSGNLVLSSAAPIGNFNYVPGASDLALSSFAPTVAIGVVKQPRAAQLLLNNWILDETGDPILDENSDPVLDAAANAPLVTATTAANVSPAAGQLVLSTVAPVISAPASYNISPPSGWLFLNVSVLTDENGVPLTDENGELLTSEDESAPTVTQSAHKVISPAARDLSLSTVAPTRAVGKEITPARADLVLSGTSPSILNSGNSLTRQPRAGQLLLNNWIVDETGDPVLDENSDPLLDAAANAPAVARTTHASVSPAAAQLALSTTNPGVQSGASLSIVPPAGDIVLSAVAPVVAHTQHQSVRPAAGNLVLSSAAPVVARTANVFVSPAAEQLQLTSAAPQVQSGGNFSLVPNFADLELTGSAPSVSINIQTAVPSGNLSLSGSAPTPAISNNLRFEIASANLRLSSLPPLRPVRRISHGSRTGFAPARRTPNLSILVRTNRATGTRKN